MIRALAVALLLASPSVAQDNDCARLSALAGSLLAGGGGPLPPVAVQDGWCVWSGLSWASQAETGQRIEADALRARGVGLDRLALAAMPERLEVQIDGLRFAAKAPDPVIDWALRVQAQRNRIDLDLALAYQSQTRGLVLERLDADFPGDNRIALRLDASGWDLASVDGLRATIGQLFVHRAELVVQSNGLFEDWALMPLALVLLQAGDVPPQVEAARARALQVVDILSSTAPGLAAPGARDALAALIGDLPSPSGTLTLTLTSQSPALSRVLLGMLFFADMPDASTDWSGSTINATWERTKE